MHLKQRGQLVVGEGTAGVFIFNQLAHLALEHQQRGVRAFGAVGALGEEEAQLDDALRRVRVLVGHGAAHRGGVNADLFRHFLDHHGAQAFHAQFQKLLLAADNDFAGAENGALALGNVAHQLHGGAEALLHVVLDLFVGALGHQHAAVAGAEAQAGQVFLVHGHFPLRAALDEDHVGLDEAGLLAVVLAAGAGVEGADELDAGVGLGGGDLRGAGQVLHIALLQQGQVLGDDQRGHFHGTAAIFKARIGLGAEAAVQVRTGPVQAGLGGMRLGRMRWGWMRLNWMGKG